jgi:singapore isolate B (sub-type 7) whole genome shotgun sequence assembly, scaffold_17
MGRTKPKLATELSILTLRLPHVEKPSSIQDQLINFLGSSRNLNGVFVAMKEEGRKTELLKDRSSQLKKHICSYIDDRYEEYITRIGEKKPMEGRAAGFTMNELGEMPQGEIPPPLAFVEKTVTDQLKEMQADVDKAVEYKSIVLYRFLTRHSLLHHHARAPNCIIDLRWIYEISNSCLFVVHSIAPN